jgi:hypothetical protein
MVYMNTLRLSYRSALFLLSIVFMHLTLFVGVPPADAGRTPLGVQYQMPGLGTDEALKEMARQLVAMVRIDPAGDRTNVDPVIGSAILFGRDQDCLYFMTANHLLEDAEVGSTVKLLPRFSPNSWVVAKVINRSDPTLDLGVLCIANPEKVFVPFPPLTLVRLGDPATVARDGPIFYFGHGGDRAWNEPAAPLRLRDIQDGLTIRFEGPPVEPGDSGGGLFTLDDGSWELVGMIRGTNSFARHATSVTPILEKLREWNLPVGLTQWDYLKVSQDDHFYAQIAFGSGGEQDLTKIKRLVAMITTTVEDQARSGAGLVIGFDGSELYIATSEALLRSDTSVASKISVQLWNGSPVPARLLDQRDFERRLGILAVSRASIGVAEIEDVIPLSDASRTSGTELPLRSPFRNRIGVSRELSSGSALVHVGQIDEERWVVSTGDVRVQEITEATVSVAMNTRLVGSVGGVLFNDRRQVVGMIVGVLENGVYSAVSVEEILRRSAAWHVPVALEPAAHFVRNYPILVNGIEPQLGTGATWAKAVGGAWRDAGQAFAQAAQGSLLVAADTKSFGAGDGDGWLLMVNNAGALVAQDFTREPFEDSLRALLVLEKGTIIAAGTKILFTGNQSPYERGQRAYSYAFQVGGRVGYLRRWQGLGGRYDDILLGQPGGHRYYPEAMVGGPEPGAVVIAGAVAEGERIVGGAMVAINPGGSFRWEAQFPEAVWIYGVTKAPNGGYFGAGYGVSRDTMSEDLWVVKVKENGDREWATSVPVPSSSERGHAVDIMSDGGVLVAGFVRSHRGGSAKMRLWRIGPHGNVEWTRDFGNDGEDAYAYGITQTRDGAFVIAGSVGNDGWLINVGADGNVQWQKRYSNSVETHYRRGALRAVAETIDGCLVAVGEARPSASLSEDVWILRLDRWGEVGPPCQG